MSRPDVAAAAPPRRGTVLLSVGLVANGMGHAFLLIVLPPLGRQLGFGDVQTGLLLSLSALTMTLTAPLWGHLCEAWGRRRLLLIGLAASALFPAALAVLVDLRLSLALSSGMTFALLLGLRLPLAAAAGGLNPASQAFMADVTSADRRAGGMGLMGAAFGVGAIGGGMLAMALGGDNLILALGLIAAVVAGATIVSWWLLPEPPRPAAATVDGDARRVPLARIWPFLGIALLGITVYSLLQQVTALRLQDGFGLTPDASIRMAGTMLMASMVAKIGAQIILVRTLSGPPLRPLIIGVLCTAAMMLLAALAPSVLVMGVAMAGIGFGMGFMFPGNLAAMSVSTGAGAQAKVAGINGLGVGLGLAAGPLLGASLHQLSPEMPFFASTGLLVVVLVLAWVGRHRTRDHEAGRSPDGVGRSSPGRGAATSPLS